SAMVVCQPTAMPISASRRLSHWLLVSRFWPLVSSLPIERISVSMRGVGFLGEAVGPNPKSEARNPKQIQNPKKAMTETERLPVSVIADSFLLVFVSDFVLRISDFLLRIDQRTLIQHPAGAGLLGADVHRDLHAVEVQRQRAADDHRVVG